MNIVHSIHRERKKGPKKEREAATTALSYFDQKLVLTNGRGIFHSPAAGILQARNPYPFTVP
jgi:hypothetical protein